MKNFFFKALTNSSIFIKIQKPAIMSSIISELFSKKKTVKSNFKKNTKSILWLFSLGITMSEENWFKFLKRKPHNLLLTNEFEQKFFRNYHKHYITINKQNLPNSVLSNYSIIGTYIRLYANSGNNSFVFRRNRRILFKEFLYTQNFRIKNNFFGNLTRDTNAFFKLFLYEKNITKVSKTQYTNDMFLDKIFSRNIYSFGIQNKINWFSRNNNIYYKGKLKKACVNFSLMDKQIKCSKVWYFGVQYDSAIIPFSLQNIVYENLTFSYNKEKINKNTNLFFYTNLKFFAKGNFWPFNCFFWYQNSDIKKIMGLPNYLMNFQQKTIVFEDFLITNAVDDNRTLAVQNTSILYLEIINWRIWLSLDNMKNLFFLKNFDLNGILKKDNIVHKNPITFIFPLDFYFFITLVLILRIFILLKTEEPETRIFFFKNFTKFLDRQHKLKKHKINVIHNKGFLGYDDRLPEITNLRPFNYRKTDMMNGIYHFVANFSVLAKYIYFPYFFPIFTENFLLTDSWWSDSIILKYKRLRYRDYLKEMIKKSDNFATDCSEKQPLNSSFFWKIELNVKNYKFNNFKNKITPPNTGNLEISGIWGVCKRDERSLCFKSNDSFFLYLHYTYNPNLNSLSKYYQNFCSSRSPLMNFLKIGTTETHFNFFTFSDYHLAKDYLKIHKNNSYLNKNTNLDEFFLDDLNLEMLWFDSLGTRTIGIAPKYWHRFGEYHENSDDFKFSDFLWWTSKPEDELKFYSPNFFVPITLFSQKETMTAFYFYNFFENRILLNSKIFSTIFVKNDKKFYTKNSFFYNNKSYYYFSFIQFDLAIFNTLQNFVFLETSFELLNTKFLFEENSYNISTYQRLQGILFFKNFEFSSYLNTFFFELDGVAIEIKNNMFFYENAHIISNCYRKTGLPATLILYNLLSELVQNTNLADLELTKLKELLKEENYFLGIKNNIIIER